VIKGLEKTILDRLSTGKARGEADTNTPVKARGHSGDVLTDQRVRKLSEIATDKNLADPEQPCDPVGSGKEDNQNCTKKNGTRAIGGGLTDTVAECRKRKRRR